MSVKFRPIHEQVIVITGASSGIGLATALMAAEKGACVVLAARNREVLQQVEQQIRARGGEALAVVTDVTCKGDLERLAEAAISAYGRIDTWVNNAGVSIFGPLEKVSEADHRQLFETNFWGMVNGSLLAVRAMRQNGGALINVGSLVSERSFPLQGMYCASKHAVKGFTDALRMELEKEGVPISVTLIKPTAIATPFQEHAKNYMEHKFQLPPPLYPPEEVAKAILHAACHQDRDVFVGTAAPMFAAWHHLSPRSLDKVSEAVLFDVQQKNEKNTNFQSNLYEPMSEGKTRTDNPGFPTQPSLYNKVRRHPILAAGLLAALGFAATGLLQRDGTATPAPYTEAPREAEIPSPT